MDVIAVEIGRQAVRGVVGNPDGVFFALERDDGGQWAEGFFLAELGVLADTGDQGRLYKTAAAFMSLPAGDNSGALAQGILDMLHDLVGGTAIDQGGLGHAIVHAIAYVHGFDGDLELVHEGIMHAVLYQEAVNTHAGLAGVAEFAGHGALHRLVQIGIIKHDEGRIAAEFQ